jgi:hypothetical protein
MRPALKDPDQRPPSRRVFTTKETPHDEATDPLAQLRSFRRRAGGLPKERRRCGC